MYGRELLKKTKEVNKNQLCQKKKNGLIVTYDEAGNAIEIHPEVDTDTTLTKSNVAADAYEVGSRLKEIRDSIDSTKESLQSEKESLQSGIDANIASLEEFKTKTETDINQLDSNKQNSLTFTKLSASIPASSFTEYTKNVGDYYAYVILDLSKYGNIICVIPLGITHSDGNGYDGILGPQSNGYASTLACSHWSVTVGQKIDFIAHFLVISC